MFLLQTTTLNKAWLSLQFDVCAVWGCRIWRDGGCRSDKLRSSMCSSLSLYKPSLNTFRWHSSCPHTVKYTSPLLSRARNINVVCTQSYLSPVLIWCSVQASGQTEEMTLTEESGLVITVPQGCPLIQSPSGCMYRVRCGTGNHQTRARVLKALYTGIANLWPEQGNRSNWSQFAAPALARFIAAIHLHDIETNYKQALRWKRRWTQDEDGTIHIAEYSPEISPAHLPAQGRDDVVPRA